jgi:hypothetical protein
VPEGIEHERPHFAIPKRVQVLTVNAIRLDMAATCSRRPNPAVFRLNRDIPAVLKHRTNARGVIGNTRRAEGVLPCVTSNAPFFPLSQVSKLPPQLEAVFWAHPGVRQYGCD